jgi:hypothetical protein
MKIGIRIESFAIIKYVVYPQTITYIIYCHAKLQLKVILASLWVVAGSFYVLVTTVTTPVSDCLAKYTMLPFSIFVLPSPPRKCHTPYTR